MTKPWWWITDGRSSQEFNMGRLSLSQACTFTDSPLAGVLRLPLHVVSSESLYQSACGRRHWSGVGSKANKGGDLGEASSGVKRDSEHRGGAEGTWELPAGWFSTGGASAGAGLAQRLKHRKPTRYFYPQSGMFSQTRSKLLTHLTFEMHSPFSEMTLLFRKDSLAIVKSLDVTQWKYLISLLTSTKVWDFPVVWNILLI